MKLKVLLILLLTITTGLSQLHPLDKSHPHDWHSVLLETPDTKAIAEHLKVYKAYDANGPIQLRRIGKANDGGYVVPELALSSADIVLGYGIANDISFEDSSAATYEKPSFGFDCTCPRIQPVQKKCHFISSCIVGEEGSGQQFSSSATFDQHVDMVGANGKNIFVKMDIEGNEYETMPDILRRASNITGIVMEIHFTEPQQITKALHLLEMLDKDFLLVHLHSNNHCRDVFVASNAIGYIPRVLELSYINRRLIQNYEISSDQTHPTYLDMPNTPNLPDVEFTILTIQDRHGVKQFPR